MEGDIDAIEEEAFARDHRTRIEPIYQMKREVVELRRSVNPLSVPFARLQTEHKDLISKEVRRYLRDVGDHHTHAADQIASYDEISARWCRPRWPGSRCSRTPTCARCRPGRPLLAVPTMVAGIYGMNFEYMPGLKWHWGYPTTIARYGGDLPAAVSQLPA